MRRVVNVQKLPDLPLWEAKFPREVLLQKSLGGDAGGRVMWQQGFRMEPVKPGDLKFPSFALCAEHSLVLSEVIARKLPTYIGLDLSSSSRPGNAIVAVAVDPVVGRRIPVEVRNGNWTSPETATVLCDVAGRHNTQFIMVENNAYQGSIIDWIKKSKKEFTSWMKIQAHTTGRNKADPQYGLPGLEVEFANRAWSFSSGEWEGHPASCDCPWSVLEREFSLYPTYGTTDVVMATWFAKTAIDKWGGHARAGKVRNLSVR